MKGNRGKRLKQYCSDYVVFDLETTGVRQNADEIIEISAVRVRKHQAADEFSTLVNPGMHIPAAASRVNHITDDMVADAPDLSEAFGEFMEFIGKDVLVGHNIHSFDLSFIYRAASCLYNTEIGNDYIDTLYMARQCLPDLPHHKLSDVAAYFHIGTEGAHRALNDCRINRKCYEELGRLLLQKQKSQPEILCPRCDAPMVKRNGMYGEFYGCSNFPRCRGTRRI